MNATPERYRAARRVIRVLSVLWLSQRKATLERLLRALFGDIVEAEGHLLEIDPTDRAVGARLRRRGVWSEAETALCKRVVQPGMTVLDVGANIGYFTLLFARLVGPAGHVHAFEPEPRNFELLQRNIARNGYTNVTAVAKAVSHQCGVQRLYKSRDNLGDHSLAPPTSDRESVEVPVVTLDEYLLAAQVDVIKLDIQGAEPGAIDGASRVISASPSLILISEFWPRNIRAFGADPEAHLLALRKRGFTIDLIGRGKTLRFVSLATDDALRALCERDEEVNLFCRKG